MKSKFLLCVLFSLNSFAQTSTFDKTILVSRFSSWGIDPDKHLASIHLLESWAQFKKNRDIIVAVVDSGIQSDHDFLTQNIVNPDGKGSSGNFGVDFTKGQIPNSLPHDQDGHGTHVSGIIKSVFPEVKLLPLKYYVPRAHVEDTLRASVKALKFAVDRGVDLINYSGGGPEMIKEEFAVLQEAHRKGILVIAAAGNNRSNIDGDKKFYPASYRLPNIITVGAHDDGLNIIPSSNYGTKSVDIAAPGYRIRSSYPGNRSAYLTGTSQATAFVTGVAALIMAKHPGMNFEGVKKIILESSLTVKNFEDKIAGGKKLDAARALDLAEKVQSHLDRLPANH